MSFNLPTEMVDLPSKGLVYPESNPLSSGQVEIKYMTAKEEDILTNQSYINKGIVIDKLLESVIVSKINFDDLVIGDKNAIMIATRILGYGAEYDFTWRGETVHLNLAEIGSKEFNEDLFSTRDNNFDYILPFSKTPITFKILTHGDEGKINKDLEGYKKLKTQENPELTTRLKYTITSVDGDTSRSTINNFVENYLLARDAKALRAHILNIQPDVDLTFSPPGSEDRKPIPITLSFFWPDI